MRAADVNIPDRRSLQLLGLAFSAITVAVALMAVALVHEHAEGKLNLTDVAVASDSLSYSVR
jgi:hypothetical protein